MRIKTDIDYNDDHVSCYNCNGSGEVMACPDDMCRGLGECIHGDGMDMCPTCEGQGELIVMVSTEWFDLSVENTEAEYG